MTLQRNTPVRDSHGSWSDSWQDVSSFRNIPARLRNHRGFPYSWVSGAGGTPARLLKFIVFDKGYHPPIDMGDVRMYRFVISSGEIYSVLGVTFYSVTAQVEVERVV